MASVVPVCNPIGHCQRCFGRGFEHSYCCIPPDPTICSPLPESILEILGHFSDRHTGTRSGNRRASARATRRRPRLSPHPYPRPAPAPAPDDIRPVLPSPHSQCSQVPSGGRGSPLPPARKFCKQVGRRPHFCRGDRAPMGGVSCGPIAICLLSRESHFRHSQ